MADILVSFGSHFVWMLLVAAFVAPLVLIRRRVQHRDRARMRASGRRTRGKVVEAWMDEEGSHITYEFLPEGRLELVRRTETFEDLNALAAQVGHEVEVAYEPFQPFYSVPLLSVGSEWAVSKFSKGGGPSAR